MMDVSAYLENIYQDVISNPTDFISNTALSDTLKKNIGIIIQKSESSKAVLAVALTSLVYKSLHPDQDVRNHQASIPNGYAGRTFDQNYITPFLRSKSFPCMAQSGWLTRSLENKMPFDYNYPGAISPKLLKQAFLDLLNEVCATNVNVESAIRYLIAQLTIQRDSKVIEIAKPKNLSINAITEVLVSHFSHHYNSRGASRLPVLAFYAIYQVLMSELKRYRDKVLLPLESHTSADSQSGRLGDLDVEDKEGYSFEAVEIKFGIPINIDILERAKEKILPSSVDRYYILSTSGIKEKDRKEIEKMITQVKNTHGCQIIVNGVVPSLKYYLRLLETPGLFIEKYAELLASDDSIKFEHKEAWNKIITNL